MFSVLSGTGTRDADVLANLVNSSSPFVPFGPLRRGWCILVFMDKPCELNVTSLDNFVAKMSTVGHGVRSVRAFFATSKDSQ